MKKNTRNFIAALVCAVLIVVGCVAYAWPLGSTFGWGLDFAGGTKTTYSAASEGDLGSDAKTVKSRLESLGLKGARVEAEGGSTLSVSLPASQYDADVVESVVATGKVELVRLDTVSDAEALAKIASAGTATLEEGSYEAFIDGSGITAAQVYRTSTSSDTYAIALSFNDEATTAFADATRELADVTGQIALVVDGTVISAPSVSQELSEGQVSIPTSLSAEEALRLVANINSGSLQNSYSDGQASDAAAVVGAQALVVAYVVALVLVLAVLVVGWVRAKVLGVAAWAGWFFSFAFLFGFLAVLAHDGYFTPTLLSLALVAVVAVAMEAPFGLLARSLANKPKVEGLLGSQKKTLGISAAAVAVYAVAAMLACGVDWGVLGVILLALVAWLLAYGLVFLQLAKIAIAPAPKKSAAKAAAAKKAAR